MIAGYITISLITFALAGITGFMAWQFLGIENDPRYAIVRKPKTAAQYQAVMRASAHVIKGGFIVWPLLILIGIWQFGRALEREAKS